MKTNVINEELINKFKADNDQFFSGSEGYIYIKDDLVLKEYKRYKEEKDLLELQEKTNALSQNGVNTPDIIDYENHKHSYNWGNNFVSYILMKRAKGSPVYAESIANLWTWLPEEAYNQNRALLISKYARHKAEELSDASQFQYDKFVNDISTIFNSNDFLIDKYGENIYYDQKQGFSLIDLVVPDRQYYKYAKLTSDNNRDLESKQGIAYVALDYVSDLLMGINPEKENLDPVKLVKPIFEKTEKALNNSDEQISREHFPKNLRIKLSEFIK